MSDPSHRGPTTLRARGVLRKVVALCATSVMLCAASCGGDDPDGRQSADPSPSTSTPDTGEPTTAEPTTSEQPATDEDKAAAALLGYLTVRDRAYETGRISNKLNKFATGQEHLALQQFIQQLTAPPETRLKGTWGHQITRSAMRADGSALLTDCEDGRGVDVVRVADSSVLPWIKFDGKELPRRLEQVYRLEKVDGRWKVSSSESLPNEVEEC